MIAEMLRALLPDIDAGLLGDLGNKIRAETFDEFLEHAESYRKEGRKNEAGVIAGVVFEDTIRRICQNMEIEGHKLEDLINALAKEGAITKQQSKQAKVASDVRISATHARWEELNIQAVEATIQFTKSLLRDHLGG
jgi:hypothetical protein